MLSFFVTRVVTIILIDSEGKNHVAFQVNSQTQYRCFAVFTFITEDSEVLCVAGVKKYLKVEVFSISIISITYQFVSIIIFNILPRELRAPLVRVQEKVVR